MAQSKCGSNQLKVMSAIERCRTAALGGDVARCENCAHAVLAYNSCRNRHCPKCQGAAAKQRLAEREAELLPARLPPACGMMMLHQTKEVNGVEHMIPVKSVSVPVAWDVELSPRRLPHHVHEAAEYDGGRPQRAGHLEICQWKSYYCPIFSVSAQ